MPHRSYASTANYRFGFNGKENDNDPKGLGNQQDYGMRIYDPRLGRFFSIDPITRKYPELTPYQFASNRPIEGVDQDGLEFEDIKAWFKKSQQTPRLSFDNKQIISIAATVMGETAHGALSVDQQVAVGWVYYNRIAKSGWDKGMRGSYAFDRYGESKLPEVWVMVMMVGMGDETYKNESSENLLQTKTIGQLSKEKYSQPFISKANTLKDILIKSFSKPEFNPYPGYTGQGYYKDLNKDSEISFKMARAYLWLQRDGKVPNDFEHTFLTMLRTPGQEKYTTFIFNTKELEQYFKKNPELLKEDIPKYDYKTDDKEKSNNE